jgi:hypothetical protein
MNEIFKSLLSVLLIFLGTLIISAFIIANSDAIKAKSFHTDTVQEIESGGMSDTVINSCIQTATDNGYTLDVEKYADENGKTVMCKVILKYNYDLPVLNILSTHECRAFCR